MSSNSQEPVLLLVEDSPADAFLVSEAIRSEGLPFHLVIADDGEAAVEILENIDAQRDQPPVNLLLLDLNLPRRDGTYVLERLRSSRRCANIPVIVMSSSNSPHDRTRAVEAGATEYFRKPSTADEFMLLGKMVRRLCAAVAKARS